MSGTLEVILGIAGFAVFFILWVVIPARVHKKHLDEEEL